MGPLLSALKLRSILERVERNMRIAMEQADTIDKVGDSTPRMLTFYMDDGVIIARQNAIRAAVRTLGSVEAKSYGFYLNIKKSRLWWP